MTPEQRAAQLLMDVEELQRRAASRFFRYFPDCAATCRNPRSSKPEDHTPGRLCRALYVKHTQYMAAGPHYNERLFLAANRIGKTETAAYEVTCHLTGLYPPWWTGRRFASPTHWWAAGDTILTTRDIIQVAMLGHIDGVDTQEWTGMIPAHLVVDITRRPGSIPKAVDQIWVRHVNGGISTFEFRSYDQGRKAFQGTAQDGIWLDEEPPDDVYGEAVIRTMTTQGMVITTLTPLSGMTPFLQNYIESAMMLDSDGVLRSAADVMADALGPATSDAPPPAKRYKLLIGATWDDAPHLSADDKAKMWASIPAYQRDARTKGIPQLGAGAIYPFPETDIRVPDFEIPRHWPRAFGLDCALAGTTAATWGALDRDTNTLYLYSVYRRSQAETGIHAEAIKARGAWIPGVGDAADVVDEDRTQFIALYRRHGIDLTLPDKAVEAGIQEVYDRLSAGKLKAFASCGPFWEEFRLYQRDEKGRVVKKNDHVLDSSRYLVRSGMRRAKIDPTTVKPPARSERIFEGPAGPTLGWMR